MERTRASRSAGRRVAGWMGRVFRVVAMSALVSAVSLLCAPAGTAAMQILEAADHAELEAEISDRAVSRIALVGDRIARVVRGPDGFAVEHDAARGDVYLRPLGRAGGEPGADRKPLTLFVGTAAGFTYRLALTPAEGGSAQILIRNAAAASEPEPPRRGDERVNTLVALVRAVARREIPPGYAVETVPGTSQGDGVATLEVWRGPRFIVRVLEAGTGRDLEPDAESLAGRLAPGTAAVWLGPPGAGPSGGRIVVAVDDASRTAPAEDAR